MALNGDVTNRDKTSSSAEQLSEWLVANFLGDGDRRDPNASPARRQTSLVFPARFSCRQERTKPVDDSRMSLSGPGRPRRGVFRCFQKMLAHLHSRAPCRGSRGSQFKIRGPHRFRALPPVFFMLLIPAALIALGRWWWAPVLAVLSRVFLNERRFKCLSRTSIYRH